LALTIQHRSESTTRKVMKYERFDAAQALREHNLKVFGQTALAVAAGRGTMGEAERIAKARADNGTFDREVPRLVNATQDDVGVSMHLKGTGGASLLSDTGLDLWIPGASQAFTQSAIAAAILGKSPRHA
jgi:hypothetical protein